jgi:hypothetical protein
MSGRQLREVAYCLAEGVRRGTMGAGGGKLILERVRPSSRPVRLDLPVAMGPPELIETEERIAAALNAATITPPEARTLQAWAKSAYRNPNMALAAMACSRWLEP